jgi:L-asparaginase
MTNNILIINTGGTFNKIYNQHNGLLQIPKNNKTIKTILNKLYKTNQKPKIKGIVYKDSLDITKKDRYQLLELIEKSKHNKIIIIHGTDTMVKTADFLNQNIKNRQIVFVGSMVPYSINKLEASTNLGMALGFLQTQQQNKIYICMNGLIKTHNNISKNYKRVVFE